MTTITCLYCGKAKLKIITMNNGEEVCEECYQSIRQEIESEDRIQSSKTRIKL